MNRRRAAGALAGAFLLAGCAGPGLRAPAPAAPAGPTVWDFSDPAAPLSASTGTAVLSPWDPQAGGWWGEGRDRSGPASGFGLPLIDGKDFPVLRLPALRPTEGISLRHNGRPNGMFRREGYVSNYTLVFDLLLPSGRRSAYACLLQTDPSNRSDADICIERRERPGVGIGGNYYGALEPGAWHRVALAIQAATGAGGTGQIQFFIDGAFVGGMRTPHEGPLNRWALGKDILLFADDNGETSELFLKSLLFEDRMMSMDEIAALGGPSLDGVLVPGPAPKPPRRAAKRRIAVIGHRGYACCAPENSLEAVDQGLRHGADHLEVDVRLSADGTAVLMHDASVERTTDGKGNVGAMTLSALQRLDAGRALSDRFAGTRVATLADALRVAKGRGRLLLDIKSADAGPAIARALQEAGADASAVWFFRNTEISPKADYRRWVPGAERLWGDPPSTLDDAGFDSLKALGVTGFDVDIDSVSREFVEAAHARGMPVFAFTFLDPPAMLRAVELGLDGVETDYPSVLDALLPERRLPALTGGGYPKLPARGCPASGLFRDGHFRELSGPPGSDFNRLLRGGAPTSEGLDCLKELGVTDIVDLRDTGEGGSEVEESAAARGLAYRRFPMGASGPTARKDACAGLKPGSVERNRRSAEAALEFLRARLKSPVPGKIFIHCAHGQDRTGLLLGVYRMQADRYSKDQAAAEMRSYRYTPYCVLEEVWKGY